MYISASIALFGCHMAGVEQLKFGRADGIVADVIQHMDELAVCLTVYFLQFDGDKVYLAEYPGREEIRGRVESVQYLFLSFDDGFNWNTSPTNNICLPPKGSAGCVGIDAQDAVYGVDDVGAYHGNLVDDDWFQFFQQFAVGLVYLKIRGCVPVAD